MTLPLYLRDAQCPKCLFGHITTVWHSAKSVMTYIPVRDTVENCCIAARKLVAYTAEEKAEQAIQIEREREAWFKRNGEDLKFVVPHFGDFYPVGLEHMKRACPNCQFVWAEAPCDADFREFK